MLGLAFGSKLMSKVINKINKPLMWYALIEIGIGLYGLLLLSLFGILPIIFDILLKTDSPFKYHPIQFFSYY